jgi:hypothetical protein
MDWDEEAFLERTRQLEAMATLKYDEYGNYRPGIKFFESLSAWLDQLQPGAERETALNFVLERLVFISDAEMTHLIETVYPDHIEAVLLQQTARDLQIPTHKVEALAASEHFRALRRRSLILGASDGARLDRLRRSAPFLSHEQFLQATEPTADLVKPMCDTLTEALDQLKLQGPSTFEQVFFVDDFSGSGETMLRKKNGQFKGKLIKLQRAVTKLVEAEHLDPNPAVTVVLYVASAQAEQHITSMLEQAGLAHWNLRVAHLLPVSVKVDNSDPAMAELCHSYWDPAASDKHKGDAPVGYAECALPVVLSHNTPNNSVCLLWADTTAEPDSLNREALFPRYERHHRERP